MAPIKSNSIKSLVYGAVVLLALGGCEDGSFDKAQLRKEAMQVAENVGFGKEFKTCFVDRTVAKFSLWHRFKRALRPIPHSREKESETRLGWFQEAELACMADVPSAHSTPRLTR